MKAVVHDDGLSHYYRPITAQAKAPVNPELQKLERELMQDPEAAVDKYRAENPSVSEDALELIARSEAFETKLSRALSVSVEADQIERWAQGANASERPSRKPVWLTAVAAAMVAAIGIGLSLAPSESQAKRLQAAMVEHVSHEQAELEWASTNSSLPTTDLAASEAGPIEYLQFCKVDGTLAVHAIIRTQSGAVTALYVPEYALADALSFTSSGRSAVMVNATNGVSGFFGESQAATDLVADEYALAFAQGAQNLLDDAGTRG